MTTETLARAHRATPFRPFALHLADGRVIPVPRRESVCFNPKGRAASVLDEGDGAQYIDLREVASLRFEGEPDDGPPRGGR